MTAPDTEGTTTMTVTYLTRRQAAERAGVNIRTIDVWLRTPGKLTTYRTVGREPIRVSQEELDALTTVRPVDPLHDHVWVDASETEGTDQTEVCALCDAYKPIPLMAQT